MTSKDQSTGLDFRTADGEDYPPPDVLFKALANSTRRRVLAALPDSSAMSIDELTDILVGCRSTADGPADRDEWAKVKIELVHAHLPLLADAGLVTFGDGEIERSEIPSPDGDLVAFAGEYEDVSAGDISR